MAVATDPTAPRKLTPGAATLDPQQTNPAMLGTDTSPASSGPNMNPIPNSATGIAQLPDGVGGQVTVPPTSMSPVVGQTWDQAIASQPVGGANAPVNGQVSGPTDLMGRPLSADGVYHPFSGPTFTTDQSGQVATFQQPGGQWTNANGSAVPQNLNIMAKDMPDWGLPGSGLGTSADPSGKLQAQAGYIPFDAATGGPAATNASSPLAGRLPIAAPSDATPSIPRGAGTLGQALRMDGSGAGAGTLGQALRMGGPSDATPSIPNGTLGQALGGSNAGASTFDADHNLINSQVNPAASPRLLGAQGMTDAALQKITNGPDRAELGKQYYDTFAQRAQNQFGHALTDATRHAANHGQLGSGMLTNAYGDLADQFNLANTTAASDFATRALEGTIGDNLNNLNAARTTENSIYTQGANDRGEQRTERGYQQNLAQQAIANRILQNQMEQGQSQQDFDNAIRLYGLGNANDPSGAYQDAATLASGEAASNSADTAALLRYFAQRRNPVS